MAAGAPGGAIISRDRGGAYAEGARTGAPHAVQIADRFHLVHNLVEALETACTRHHAALRAAAEVSAAACATTRAGEAPTEAAAPVAARAPAPDAPGVAAASGAPLAAPRLSTEEQEQQDRRARRHAQYAEGVALRQAGRSKQAIARSLGLARSTVAHWLAAGQFPERARPTRRRPCLLDAYAAEIAAYGAAGGTSATALLARLTPLGFRGTHVTVWRALHAWRIAHGAAADHERSPHAPAAVRVPSPRQTAWLLRTPADALKPEQRAYVTALMSACPALADAQALGERFVRLLHERDVAGFDAWRAAAEASELRGFARGLRRDDAAVRQAMTSLWSNGQVEGQVHRIKLVKRTMFGRAGLALLRARVLHAA